MERTFDWKPRFDERSRSYSVLRGVDYSNKYVYRRPPREVLDQGSEGACVGFSTTAAILASPHKNKLKDAQDFALGAYKFAQFIDVWEGEDYDGTSVLAGAKVMHKLGMIDSYSWCFNTNDIVTALHQFGPVVLGIPWYSDMYETDKRHFVNIGGDLVGGHAIMVYGYHPRKYDYATRSRGPVFYWRNSWGKEYGRNGTGYIRKKDLDTLMSQQGEACVFR